MIYRICALLALLALACSPPTTSKPDASTTPHVAHAHRHRSHGDGGPAEPTPLDSRTQACLGRPYASWDALSNCVGGAVTEDAGHHLLGATRPPPVCAAQSIPAWFVNPSSGSDTNTCVDSGHPCKTYREIASRWGCGGGPVTSPVLSSAVSLTFMGSQPDTTDRPIIDPIINEGGSLHVIGTWTQLAMGTLSSVVAKSTSAVDGRLTVTLGAAATGHLGGAGLLLVNTTRSSSVAIVNEVISGTTVALTQPLASNAPAAPTRVVRNPAEFDTWANGDTWQLMQLPSVYITEAIPKTPQNDLNEDSTFMFVEHIYVPDPSGQPFVSNLFLGQGATWTESWIDEFAFYPLLSNGGGAQFVNTFLNGGAVLRDANMVGGAMVAGAMIDLSTIDGDAIINDDLEVFGSGASLGRVCGDDADIDVFTQLALLNEGPNGYGDPHIYGTYTLDVSGASATAGTPGAALAYDAAITAAGNFLGHPTWQIDHNVTASARDRTHTPSQDYPGIAVSAANLDLALASGGFGGVAFGYAGSVIAPTNLPTIGATSPYFVAGSGISLSTTVGGALTISASGGATCPINLASCASGVLAVSNGGTGTGSLCGANQVLQSNGIGYVCATPAVCPINLASCVGGTLPVGNGGTGTNSLCPSGQYLQSNGASYVCTAPAGGGGASCPINLASCTTGVLPVVNGGTGNATNTAHAVPIGEGTSPFAFASPGTTSGFPLVSNGSGNDPIFALLGTGGGGTGTANPGPAGNVLQSNGSTWITAPWHGLAVVPQSCASGSVSLGATPLTLCSVTVTTPNDGVTRPVIFFGTININNTNNSTSWSAAWGYSIFQDTFNVMAGGTSFSSIDAMNRATTQAPNTSTTYNLTAQLNSGASGVFAFGTLVALVF